MEAKCLIIDELIHEINPYFSELLVVVGNVPSLLCTQVQRQQHLQILDEDFP